MMHRNWLFGLAVVIGMGVMTARAEDTVKLNLKPTDAVQTKNLLGDGTADTVNVHRWYGGRYYARPYYHHHYSPRYYYPRAYWGWRGFYPGVGVYVGSPYYYAPYYYGAAYYDYVAPAAAPVYYSEPVVVAPTGFSLRVPFVSLTISRAPRVVAPAATETIPAPRKVMPNDGGTYQYDGGPANPVPMPPADPAPSRLKPAPVAPEGRTVSLQASAPKYRYAAYGEKLDSPVKADSQLAAKIKK